MGFLFLMKPPKSMEYVRYVFRFSDQTFAKLQTKSSTDSPERTTDIFRATKFRSLDGANHAARINSHLRVDGIQLLRIDYTATFSICDMEE